MAPARSRQGDRHIDRRRFITGLTGAAIAAASWGCTRGVDHAARAARRGAVSWGDNPLVDALVPPSVRPEGVLEIFMLGGPSPWDSFYVVPEHGDPSRGGAHAGQQWWTHQSGTPNIPELFEQCGGAGRDLLMPWTTASDGRTVNLGPFLWPLRERPDLIARMRSVVMRHDALPHLGAVPLVLTGHPRGNQRMATSGAHIQRYFGDRDALEGIDRAAPYAYTLFPDTETVAGDNAESAVATGLHRASARPLAITLSETNPLARYLTRNHHHGYAGEIDSALAWYTERYANRLRAPGASARSRAAALTDFETANAAVARAESLTSLISPEVLTPIMGSECAADPVLDTTAMQLRLAAHLLTAPEQRARYVQVMDVGIGDGIVEGYDTHNHHVRVEAQSLTHLCHTLDSIVNRPGENDPGKLDLDRHLILLTTEMGRTPYPQPNSIGGLDHWPYGFVCTLIGGPIDTERAGLVGAIGENAVASDWATPAEWRAAILLAQGIWPFSTEGFAVGDVRDATSNEHAARIVAERVLGRVG